MMFNLNKKHFRGVSNNSNGEVNSSTLFTYHQEGNIIWGSYEGGTIVKGSFVGRVTDGNHIEFNYTHINLNKTLLSGFCHSTIEVLDSGKIRLQEKWSWTSGKSGTGESVIEEV